MRNPEIGGGPPRGRGASSNPANRFTPIKLDSLEAPPEAVPTEYFVDESRSVLSRNDSPDVGFNASLNPYRGCEHGCIYCYARPSHEYLGFSAGLEFETRIMVKTRAPELLRAQLLSPRWKPEVLALSGVTDPYQPVERELEITRGCLRVLAEFRNPVGIITKGAGVLRDIDYLAELASVRAASVTISITTLDSELARRLEPRALHPNRRLEILRRLCAAGIPCGVMVSPLIPGLTDHELPSILRAAAEAGAGHASFAVLRLPGAVSELFLQWLDVHYPARRAKVINRIRSLRRGNLNEARFGVRMRGEGIFAEQIRSLFQSGCRKWGLASHGPALSSDAFSRPGRHQPSLFD